MKLSKAQNIITILFLVLMVINIVAGLSLFTDAGVMLKYLQLYSVHLGIIIAFYFSQGNIQNRKIDSFRLVFLILLLLLWNGGIMGTTVLSYNPASVSYETIFTNIDSWADYANFLVAGGIVFYYNGKSQ